MFAARGASATTADRRKAPPAPQPRERPFGTLGLLYAMWQNPLLTWTTRHFEEPIVTAQTVLGRIAVVSDPAGIKQVLVDNATNYHKGPLQRRLLGPGLGQGLLTTEGETWRKQRRALAPLFTPRVVEAFAPAMGKSGQWMVDRWLAQRPGRILDISGEMSRLTLDVLERTLFPDGLARKPGEFGRAVTLYFETIGRVDPLDVLGLPDWVPRIGRRNAAPALRFFGEAVDAIISARRTALQTGSQPTEAVPDLLTLLLRAADPDTGHGLSEGEVRANILTFIAAGHETTANTLTWTLFLLSTHPNWRADLEAEVDALLPNGSRDGLPAGAGWLERLPLARAIVEEALRLYPPAASLTRQALAADVIAGRRIDKGTIVVVSPWVLHRHRRLWNRPEEFDPSRFLPPARGVIERFAYLPFGAGPRICIGASFALQEAIILLAIMVSQFRFELAENAQVMPVQRVTLRPGNGMPMMVKRRR
jgi:cytochrome P450